MFVHMHGLLFVNDIVYQKDASPVAAGIAGEIILLIFTNMIK
jgi:hypothetical protein